MPEIFVDDYYPMKIPIYKKLNKIRLKLIDNSYPNRYNLIEKEKKNKKRIFKIKNWSGKNNFIKKLRYKLNKNNLLKIMITYITWRELKNKKNKKSLSKIIMLIILKDLKKPIKINKV